MAKDKKTIKYEADISGFKKNIQAAENSIKTLNNQLKLNQAQLKGNNNSVEVLGQRLEQLKEKYKEQTTVVENTTREYEKAVEVYGENSREAENLKNKLIQAETKQQSIANSIKETNTQLTLQSEKFITTGAKLQNFGDKTSKIGDGLNKLGNKLSIVSAGITTLAGAAIKTSIDYESAWTGVTKTVDGTERQMSELREGILQLSTQLPSAATEIAGVAEGAGQLGIQTENVLAFTETMINMGNATNLSADEAATTLARFANITKMSQSDFDKLGSVIVALGNNFATTEAEIADMGMNLASAGTQVGMSQSQIMALATALSSVGLEAQAGGTAFSKVMVNMQLAVEKGGKDLKNFATVAGMSSKDFQKAFKEDATNAIMQFVDGLSKSGERGKSAIKILDDMGITETRLRDALLRSANASEVMSNAIEVGNKAWNENKALTDEASKRYETTESKLKMLKNEITKSGIALGDELKPALINVLEQVKPIISNVTSLVTSFNKLDDATKKQIINMGAITIAAGPILKIGGKLITSVGSGVKSIGTLTKAIGVFRTKINSGVENVDNLAKTLTKIASPAGLATIAVTGLVATLTVLAIKRAEAVKETKELSEETANARQSFEEYNKSIDDVANKNLAQINSASSLKEELKTLVDENGKVKESYEGRVNFILNQLNEALGTEYKLNNGIVQNYKDLQNEIDGTIEKKRAEIILNAEQEKYANARDDEIKAVKKLKEVQDELGMSYEEAKTKLENLKWEAEINREGNGTDYWTSVEIENLENLISSYENTENEIKQCTEIKKQYENDYALYTENRYNEMGSTIIDTTKKWADSSLREIQNNIVEQKRELQENKNIYEKYGSEIAQQQMQQAQRNLENLANELIARTSTIDNLGTEEILAWKTLAENSYEEYQKAISKVSPKMQDEIQKTTGVIAVETPYAKQTAENYINSIINSLDKDEQFRKEAVDSLNAYLSGLSDEEKREFIKQAGVQDVNKVMEGLQQGKQLSEEQGVEILKGLKTGLQDNGLIISAINQAKNIASRIVGAFSIDVPSIINKTTKNAAQAALPGHKDGLDYVPYDNYVARLHKGERVLTAEENKRYTNGNINNKLATQNITVNFYPQSMSTAEMERAFIYIDKRLGNIY